MSDREKLNIHEPHEHAELVHADTTLAPVSLTMAILAVIVALISSLGHRAHNEVLLSQTQANFQKAELVGIATQKHADAVLLDTIAVLTDKPQQTDLKEKMEREIERYAHEEKHAQAEETRLEEERLHYQKKANRLDLGELLAEVGLVLCSITLLTRQRFYWLSGMIAGATGLAMSVWAFWLS